MKQQNRVRILLTFNCDHAEMMTKYFLNMAGEFKYLICYSSRLNDLCFFVVSLEFEQKEIIKKYASEIALTFYFYCNFCYSYRLDFWYGVSINLGLVIWDIWLLHCVIVVNVLGGKLAHFALRHGSCGM